jgi:hypothetical protein
MQASTAPNETRLPRQVLRRSAAIQAHLDARKVESKTDPVDQNQPPAKPSVPTTTTAAAQPNESLPGTPPADPRENDPAYWKQRFRTAEGRLRVLADEHREVTEGLQQQISMLTEQIRDLKASAPAAPIDLSEFLTQEQIESMGEDEARTIVTTALTAARKEVKTLVDQELAPLRQQKTDQQATDKQSLQRAFLTKLTELAPDWEQYDQTEEFEAWLMDVDEGTGLVRNDVLQSHIRAASAGGVAKIFKAYKASLPKTPAPPVAPNGSGAGPSGSPPATPTAGLTAPTASEVREFYKRASTIRKGKPGYVTDQERAAFDKRMKLRARQ